MTERGTPPERCRKMYLNIRQLQYPRKVACPRCGRDPEFMPACLLCRGGGTVTGREAALERRRREGQP